SERISPIVTVPFVMPVSAFPLTIGCVGEQLPVVWGTGPVVVLWKCVPEFPPPGFCDRPVDPDGAPFDPGFVPPVEPALYFPPLPPGVFGPLDGSAPEEPPPVEGALDAIDSGVVVWPPEALATSAPIPPVA